MHIGLTFDLQTDPTDARQAEFDPPATIEALQRALESLGHHVTTIGSAATLRARGPAGCGDLDLVFNIAEGVQGRCREAWVPTLLELYGIPYVGSDPLALMIGLDKALSKRLATASGVLTPRWMTLDPPQALPAHLPLLFPVIVKPRYEGSGRGIDAGAVVRSREALAQRVRWLIEQCRQPVLIEEFIEGGELTVCLIGNGTPEVLPAIQRPLDPATGLSCHVVTPTPSQVTTPLGFTPALEQAARHASVTMFQALGCRDVARVDLRVDEAGRVWFLEINPLPSFDPDGSFGLIAECAGVPYATMIGRVLDAALGRMGHVTTRSRR